MKVAIQGIGGSFHDQAAHEILPNQEIELLPCTTFQDVFEAVSTGKADKGVVAIENTIHGSINIIYRLFGRHDLWIEGETRLHINQYLIGSRDISLATLQGKQITVLSQGPALAQCELWLDKHLPHAIRQESHDTADSVRLIMETKQPDTFAIAGKHAASMYGGTIIAGPINDEPHNYTRFVLLGRTKTTPSDATRTTIILTTDHAPGALVHALNIFSAHNINLSKLDSHPIANDSRHYLFYIDLEIGLDSDDANMAFLALRKRNYAVKILGSYRV